MIKNHIIRILQSLMAVMMLGLLLSGCQTEVSTKTGNVITGHSINNPVIPKEAEMVSDLELCNYFLDTATLAYKAADQEIELSERDIQKMLDDVASLKEERMALSDSEKIAEIEEDIAEIQETMEAERTNIQDYQVNVEESKKEIERYAAVCEKAKAKDSAACAEVLADGKTKLSEMTIKLDELSLQMKNLEMNMITAMQQDDMDLAEKYKMSYLGKENKYYGLEKDQKELQIAYDEMSAYC